MLTSHTAAVPGEAHSHIQVFGQRLALFSAFAFAATAFSFDGVASGALYLLALATLLQWRDFLGQALHEPVCWAFLLFVLTVTLLTYASIPADEADASYQWSRYRDWLRLWAFIPLAWAVGPYAGRRYWLLGLGAFSFFLGRMLEIDAIYLSWMWYGLRSGLGYQANGFGLYAAILFAGLILLHARIRVAGTKSKAQRRWRYALWLGLLLISLQFLLSSQSRGAWLSLIIIAPLLYLAARAARPGGHISRRAYRRGSLLALLLATALVAVNHQNISQRTDFEADSYAQFRAQAKVGRVSSTGSLALRVLMVEFGLQHWQQKPLLGWGPGASHRLIREQPILANRSHLHNGYVEVLLQFGMLGLALCSFVFLRLIHSLRVREHARHEPFAIRASLACGLGLLALGWCYDYMIQFQEWRYCWILLGGLSLSYRWPRVATLADPASPKTHR